MDWARAIERNSEALKAIVAALFVMLAGGTMARLPRTLHLAVLRVLRPAEPAVRRLIVIAARGLVVKLAPTRLMPQGLTSRRGGRQRVAFRLFDPRKRFAPLDRKPGPRCVPRIWVAGHDPIVAAMWAYQRSLAPKPTEDGLVDGRRLTSRLEALKLALDDLPRQAKRLVRARARRDKIPSLRLKSPLRPGRPPGHRKIAVHDVDHVLAECHALARDVLAPDTS